MLPSAWACSTASVPGADGTSKIPSAGDDSKSRYGLGRVVAATGSLDLLAIEDKTAAELVKLRIFAGLSVDEAGKAQPPLGDTDPFLQVGKPGCGAAVAVSGHLLEHLGAR